MAKTTRALQTLVAQILEVSRLETRHMSATLEPINIKLLLQDLAEEFVPIAAEKNLVLRVKPLDVTVCTDQQLLMRALRNLVINAINYTKQGEIVLAARLIGQNKVSLCVVDSGEGIDVAEQKRIFDHFYRSEKTRDSAEGFGLGLSIVRGICKQLDMKLSFSSKVGKGSIFRIQLPLHEAEQVRIFTQAKKDKTVINELYANVLLIEDNAVVRESLQALMQSWGLRVKAFGGFNEELEKLLNTNDQFDVIVSDYNLGLDRTNGLQVMLEINRRRKVKVPSVLLTAVGNDKIQDDYRQILSTLSEEEVKYFALPKILQKPVSGSDLSETIRSVLEKP